MSVLAATQVPKPSDPEAFERLSVFLWRAILEDPTADVYARRGQGQEGVDIYGRRNGTPGHHVGIQCKCKSDGAVLTASEVKDEVEKARTFQPALKEYFITTTAPNDRKLHELARLLTEELQNEGLEIQVNVWGWNTLEQQIRLYPHVEKYFDPSYTPQGEILLKRFDDILQALGRGDLITQAPTPSVAASRPLTLPGDEVAEPSDLDRHIDNQINRYRTHIQNGKPNLALGHLKALLQDLPQTVSGRILFRIKANIGHCYYDIGDDVTAAAYMLEAYEHAPHERRAIANKAFGLLLRGEWAEVIDFSRRELLSDPENDELAGFMVQAAIFEEVCLDPLPWVPERLRQTAAVTIAMVEFRRRRGEPGAWQMAAKNAWSHHPESKLAARFAAEAEIQEIVTDEAFFRTQVIAESDRARLVDAVALLIDQWEHIRATDGQVRPEDAALCGNILVALRRLCDFPKALEIAKQGIDVAPSDENLLIRAAVVAIDADDDDFARSILSKLPPSEDATQLRIALYSSQGDARALSELLRNETATIPEIERVVIETACELERLRGTPSDQLHTPIDALISRIADDPRANILLAGFARERGLETVAITAFRRALGAITPDSHMAPRIMVALHAVRIGEWRVVADLLDQHVAEVFDSEELRALATAMANDHPIREKAVRFFSRLPNAIRTLPFYMECEAVQELNRGENSNAEKLLRDLLPGCRSTNIYILFFQVLDRTDRVQEFERVISSADLGLLKGSGSQKMILAHILYRLGMFQQASDFAFMILSTAINDPDVILKFISLFLMDSKQQLIPETDVVGIDCWVHFQESNGNIIDFLISPDGPEDKRIPVDHSLAINAMGHRVGDELFLPVAGGESRRLVIHKIQDKRLHKLQDLIARFNVRFPEAKGLTKIPVVDENSLQPFLDQVRQAAEFNQRCADLHLTQNFPAHMVACLLKADPISFAEYIRSLNGEIRACNGLSSERDHVLRDLAAQQPRGAVLDTYSAWVVSTLGLFDILAAVFGDLIIAASDLDALRILKEENRNDGNDVTTVAWVDGQFVRHVETAESVVSKRDLIDFHFKNIERHCHVRPSTAPDNPGALVEQCVSCFGLHVFDSAFLARDVGYLLTEDMHYRELAQKEFGVKGAWLQVVLYFALLSNRITRQRYNDALVQLAQIKHSHLFMDAHALIDVLERDDTEELIRFQTIVSYIGGPLADIRSHVRVTTGFLRHIWTLSKIDDLKRMSASGTVLGRLFRGRINDWPTIIDVIRATVPPDCIRYVDEWMTGHFMFLPANHPITTQSGN